MRSGPERRRLALRARARRCCAAWLWSAAAGSSRRAEGLRKLRQGGGAGRNGGGKRGRKRGQEGGSGVAAAAAERRAGSGAAGKAALPEAAGSGRSGTAAPGLCARAAELPPLGLGCAVDDGNQRWRLQGSRWEGGGELRAWAPSAPRTATRTPRTWPARALRGATQEKSSGLTGRFHRKSRSRIAIPRKKLKNVHQL